MDGLQFDADALLVLIETYWNVKARESVAPHTEHLSINRNILECKVLNTAGTLLLA